MRSGIRLAVLMLGGMAAAFVACKNSATGPNSDLGNLLSNGSFELSGHPTFGHWDLLDTPADTTTLFQQDVPPLGGSYCLELKPPPITPNVARSYVTGILSLGGIFRVTVWGRAINDWAYGSIALGKMSQGFPTILKSKQTSSGNWTQYTLEDTLDLSTEDSLFVQLSPGADPELVFGRAMRFDLVKLEQIR